MNVRASFPCEVVEIEHAWITLSDGTRLAARLWLPADAEAQPVPAILEYLPYRKRDGTRWRDEPMHRWFAGHGYAAVRVDLRGCGESEGLLLDEYLPREQQDGLEVLAWIARQSWCTGAVGMLGKSWGGFNALQIAALGPPELRAVIAVCATDDRYADDAHYMGGCLLVENLTWGALLFSQSALPPDPDLVGAAWRELWLRRLESNPLFPARWLAHPLRDAYWRQGSVCEDFAAIRCPVLAVGGWADAYSNAVPRLLAGLQVPRRGLVGPWAHRYPHNGLPGPAIGFLQEAAAWWQRWLGDQPASPDSEPFFRAWMQDGERPRADFEARPGRWIAEDRWPPAQVDALELAPRADGSLAREGEADGERSLAIRSPQTVGAAAGVWCAFGMPGDLPGDQREDDAGSLCFDSSPLESELEILGAVELELEFASDRPRAQLAARLCELFPDGTSARVTYGVLELTHRDGHTRAEALAPGRRYRAHLRLNDTAHRFGAGNRLRLALSSSYWPILWPAPEVVTLGLFPAGCRLRLPRRAPRAEDAALPPFEAPEAAAATPVEDLHPGGVLRRRWVDEVTGEHVLHSEIDLDEAGEPALTHHDAIGLVSGHAIVETLRIHPDDPLSARCSVRHCVLTRRAEWITRVETRLDFSADAAGFRLQARLEAREGGERVFERSWDEHIPLAPLEAPAHADPAAP